MPVILGRFNEKFVFVILFWKSMINRKTGRGTICLCDSADK